MEISWVDLVFKALKICGNKPINDVIKATEPDIIMIDTFSSAHTSEIRFKGLEYSSQPYLQAPLMW